MDSVKGLIQKHKEQIVGILESSIRFLSPPISESKTSAAVADHLKSAGRKSAQELPVTVLSAFLRTKRPGPTLLIRGGPWTPFP